MKFKATKKQKKLIIPNKKLAENITKQAISDLKVTNAIELLKCFLRKRRIVKKQAYLRLQPKKLANDAYCKILMAVKDEGDILKDINRYWENF